MYRFLRLISLFLFSVPLLAFAGPVNGNVRLAAAADLQPVLPPILAQFQAKTGIHVDASYKSSGTLTTQIENGAPFDLFMAADMSFPERVIKFGLGDRKVATPYAHGTLVLWTRNDSPFHDLSIRTFLDPALHKIAIANPETAPYGRAAQASLESLSVYGKIKPKLVIAENIAQAAQYADSGNADVGLISLTSALTPQMKSAGHYFVMPKNSYPAILQGAVVLKHAHSRDAAYKLLDFIMSPAVKKQLAQRGLDPPK